MDEKISRESRIVQQLRLMDDDFMRACLRDNIPGVQLILRIILQKPKLVVQKMETQKDIKNLKGRSLCFDVWAKSDDEIYNIEIERTDGRASPKRARYHSSMLDADVSEPGENLENLVETFVVFITEKDIFHKGKPIYHYDRYCQETDKKLNDGAHIIFVNGQYEGDDDMGNLMNDFRCTNASDMVYTELAERVRHLKESEEGEKNMCRLVEEYGNERAQEGIQKGRIEGENRFSTLVTKLKELGREGDAFKAAADPDFRNQLYQQYNL